jgi:hypothetical protein
MPSKSVLSFPPLRDRLDRSLIQSHPSQRSSESSQQDFQLALREFEEQNPDYVADAELSALRSTEFSRLKSSGTVYVDYMGGSLYPESLVSRHLELLKVRSVWEYSFGLPNVRYLLLKTRPYSNTTHPGQCSPTPTSRPPAPRCSTLLMHLPMNTSVSSRATRLGRSSSWVKRTPSPVNRPMSCQPIVTIVSMAFGDSRIRPARRCNIWTLYIMVGLMRQR